MGQNSGQTVYDFGMANGGDVKYYLRKGFNVIGVEANPVSCANVEAALGSEIGSGRLKVVNKAIGEEAGALPFFVCDEMTTLSTASPKLVKEWTERGHEFREIEVEFCRANEVFAQDTNPYFVKIDIEGFDLICLRQILTNGIAPEYVSLEVDFANFEEAIALCEEHGFSEFQIIDQSTIGSTQDVITAQDGSQEVFSFRPGNAGKFGADLDESWAKAEIVTAQLERIRIQFKMVSALRKLLSWSAPARALRDALLSQIKIRNSWYDLHARRAG